MTALWLVELRSGSHVDFAHVRTDTMVEAIDAALVEMEDEGEGGWPYTAIDCDITVRRLES